MANAPKLPRGAATASPPAAARARSAETWAVEAWLMRQRRWVVLAVVLASVALRAVYFIQFSQTPFLDFHRWGDTDMNYFDAGARRIAQGDWLSMSGTIPMHSWHHEIAQEYFRGHPEEQARLVEQAALSGGTADADTLLWRRWSGERRFYQDPLYAYLLAATYRLLGPDVIYVFFWQLAVGVLSNLLIYSLARRYFGELAGLLAAALAVGCAPLMYYELLLLRESLLVFAGLAAVWLTDRALAAGRWPWFAAAGVAWGAGFLLKSTFALLAICLAAGLAVHYRRQWRRMLAPFGALAAGVVISAAPLVARNVAVGAPPLALAALGTITFVSSNGPDYGPDGGFQIPIAWDAQVMGDTNGRFLPAAVQTLRAHSGHSFLAMLWHKLDNNWHWYEIPNNDNFHYIRMFVPVLACMPVTFWILAPLSLVGLGLGVRRFRRAWPLYLLVANIQLSLLAFLVLGRLRVALLAALIPFAALTLATAIRWLRSRRYARVAGAALALALLGLWTGRPLPDCMTFIRPADWFCPYLMRYDRQIKEALAAKDYGQAAEVCLESFRYEPRFVREAAAGGALPSPQDRHVAHVFGIYHNQCARLLQLAGRPEQAREQAALAEPLMKISQDQPAEK